MLMTILKTQLAQCAVVEQLTVTLLVAGSINKYWYGLQTDESRLGIVHVDFMFVQDLLQYLKKYEKGINFLILGNKTFWVICDSGPM